MQTRAKARKVAGEATELEATKEYATKKEAIKEVEQTMSAEDAAPAKAEAAVQVWPGLLPLTVAHRPAGLYLEGSSRTPGTPEASCDAAGLLRARRSPETDARACGRAICLRVESWSERNPGPLRRSCTLTCNVPTGFSDVLCIQVKTYASSFRTLALIGVAAAFCAVVKNGCWREGGASPTSTKALVTSAYGSACPPQWLPVLLTFNSRHDDSPTSPLATLSTWQCNPQDGSVSQNGVTVDASVPCNWGLTGLNRQVEATASSGCSGAETLAAIEKKEVDRRNLQVVVVRHNEDISWSDSFAAVKEGGEVEQLIGA